MSISTIILSIALGLSPMPPDRRPIIVPLKEMFDRPPPASPEAEMSLLGALIIDPSKLAEVRGVIPSREAFHDQRHATMYDAMLSLVDELGTFDLVIYADMLRCRRVLDDVGGMDYLLKLCSECISPAHAKYYAKIVRDHWDLRKVIESAGQTVYEAYHASTLGEDGPVQVVRRAETRIAEIASSSFHITRPERAGTVALRVASQAMDENTPQGPCVGTGYWEFDTGITGLRPGDVMVLAARPGSGKTAMALCLAAQMCGGPDQAGALFVSRETNRERLMHRLLAIESGVPSAMIRERRLRPEDRDNVSEAASRINEWALTIDDRSMTTITEIHTGVRMLKHRHKLDVVFLDYLQIIGPPTGKGVRYTGGEEKIAAVSTAIKAMALEQQVAVVCLAQLNREMLKRGDSDQRPKLSDLRGSGQIEQDADVIGLMHRPWIHLSPAERADNEWNKGTTHIYFDKVRDGEPFMVTMDFKGPTTRFVSLPRPIRGIKSDDLFDETAGDGVPI